MGFPLGICRPTMDRVLLSRVYDSSFASYTDPKPLESDCIKKYKMFYISNYTGLYMFFVYFSALHSCSDFLDICTFYCTITQLRHMKVIHNIHTHTHTHIYIYIYIYI